MDDKHIVAQARRGELSAFEELVTRYEKRVYAIALRSSGSPEDAADITQEVFLRAWRSMKDFRGDSGFATWLFRITMNQCVDHARHRQSQPPTQPLVQGEDDEERERRRGLDDEGLRRGQSEERADRRRERHQRHEAQGGSCRR